MANESAHPCGAFSGRKAPCSFAFCVLSLMLFALLPSDTEDARLTSRTLALSNNDRHHLPGLQELKTAPSHLWGIPVLEESHKEPLGVDESDTGPLEVAGDPVEAVIYKEASGDDRRPGEQMADSLCDGGSYGRGWWHAISGRQAPYQVASGDDFHPALCSQGPERHLLQWQPATCSLRPFSRDALCRLVSGRGVLLVGDSITGSQTVSLYHLLRSPDEDPVLRHKDLQRCEDPELRGAGCKPTYVCREFYPETGGVELIHLRAMEFDETRTFIKGEPAWGSRFGLLVLNYAAHAHGTGVNPADFRVTMQHKVVPVLRRLALLHRVVVVYRAAVEGVSVYHSGPFCFEGLVGKGPMIEREWETYQAPSNFGWDQFKAFNEVAAETLENVPGAVYLDVREATIKYKTGMPGTYVNSWGDCLHHCLPGVPDSWNFMMYHVLAGRGGVPRLEVNGTSNVAL